MYFFIQKFSCVSHSLLYSIEYFYLNINKFFIMCRNPCVCFITSHRCKITYCFEPLASRAPNLEISTRPQMALAYRVYKSFLTCRPAPFNSRKAK